MAFDEKEAEHLIKMLKWSGVSPLPLMPGPVQQEIVDAIKLVERETGPAPLPLMPEPYQILADMIVTGRFLEARKHTSETMMGWCLGNTQEVADALLELMPMIGLGHNYRLKAVLKACGIHESRCTDLYATAGDFNLNNDIFVSLHTGDPSATPYNNEVTYATYARVAVARKDIGIEPNELLFPQITFPAVSDGAGVVTHFGVYDAPRGGRLLLSNEISPTIQLSTGTTPQLARGMRSDMESA